MRKKITGRVLILLLAIVLIGSTLRASIVSVGPVMIEIITDLKLSFSASSLLITIPLICFALGSAFMPRFSSKHGLEKMLFFSTLLLGVGIFIRSSGSVYTLFLGSVLLGIAITIGNVLMPPLIKKYFPNQIGVVTSIYLISINLVSAIAIGVSIRMGAVFDLGWKSSIGVWIVLSVFAFVACIPILRMNAPSNSNPPPRFSARTWKSPLAWQISLFLGMQSVIYYVLAAWLPSILHSWGMPMDEGAWMLSYAQMAQVPMMILGPLFSARSRGQKVIVCLVFLTLLSGLLLIILAKTKFIVLATILCGMSMGLAFALATMFFNLRTKNVADATALSGMAQSVGYFVAACFPPLFGVLYSWSQSWVVPLAVLLAVPFIMIFTGLRASKDRFIGD